MAGQHTGQLVVAERLEVRAAARWRARPLAASERPVGDLADERLDEAVLAALGRARVGLDLEQLAPHQVAQAAARSRRGQRR